MRSFASVAPKRTRSSIGIHRLVGRKSAINTSEVETQEYVTDFYENLRYKLPWARAYHEHTLQQMLGLADVKGWSTMKERLLNYWDSLRSSFWFLPAIMVAAAIVLAYSTIALDRLVQRHGWPPDGSWVYSGSAEGASLVLSTIAGSMATIAGVVFSMTLVALSLAFSQLGPRLLRNFMRDTANQVVLGTFVATFVYCLLILRSIRRGEGFVFVPHLSVSFGVLLAIVGLAVLIYFIHHVAISIQADEVISRVSTELIRQIDRLFPERVGREATDPAGPPDASQFHAAFDGQARTVGAAGDGYVHSIARDDLATLAKEEDLLLRLERRPGQYVVMGCPLVTAWPADRVTESLESRILDAFILGYQHTAAQDIEFSIHQLVEIAVRALSPGINDPFTAIACVDRLGSALHRLVQRDLPPPYRYDDDGGLRLVVPAFTFPDIANAAFNQIRQHARSSTAVTIRLLETIAVIAAAASRAEDQAALCLHAQMIFRGALEALPEETDLQEVEERYLSVGRSLRVPSAPPVTRSQPTGA